MNEAAERLWSVLSRRDRMKVTSAAQAEAHRALKEAEGGKERYEAAYQEAREAELMRLVEERMRQAESA